jgi:hypothetical protein
LIDVLPKGSKFNVGDYISHIYLPLPEILAPDQDEPRRHFLIQACNARLHDAKTITHVLDHKSLPRALNPSDSPNLAPSDVWLFGHLKGVLQGSSFDEPDELLFAIQEVLRGIDPEILDAVFQEWMI